VRRFISALAAPAIGATMLFAAPALAETSTVQHESVSLHHDEDWHQWYVLNWGLRHGYRWDLEVVPHVVPGGGPIRYVPGRGHYRYIIQGRGPERYLVLPRSAW
jgi:hypothetical protein